MSELTVHELLVEGRNLLAKGGVSCGLYKTHEGAYCARGAILAAGGVEFDGVHPACSEEAVPGAVEALRALVVATDRSPSEGFAFLASQVAGWNNACAAYGRGDEVIEGFDKAIQQTAPQPDVSFLSEVQAEKAGV